MTVKAKMRCSSILDDGNGKKVILHAVYSSDKNSENYSYSQATPSASLDMYVTNPLARDYFQTTKEYVLTFEATE